MTETKSPAPQVNVRAPIEAKDTLLRVGRLIRGTPDFLPKLQAFLDSYEGETLDQSLADRVDRLEALVAEMRGDNGSAR